MWQSLHTLANIVKNQGKAPDIIDGVTHGVTITRSISFDMLGF